jgi:uridine kinase
VLKRTQVLREIASRIVEIDRPHPIRVAIDGVDAAGKTTLARELAPLIEGYGRTVVRASIDGFHNPASIRYQRGTTSSEGYYQDSFDYRALVELLLTPLGPGGALQYRSAIFDYKADSGVQVPLEAAEANTVLLFDGIFLLRPELREHWDFIVFIEASFDVTLARAITRDLGLFGSAEEIRRRFELRYTPGQKIYLEECRPKERATVVVDNNDPWMPVILKRTTSEGW